MKKDTKINSIHDKLFFDTFCNIPNMRTFLHSHLPATVREQINLSQITIENTSYSENSFKYQFSDLVVKTKLKDSNVPADIYIIFEHKTEEKDKIFIQLLLYMTQVWRKDIEENEKKKERLQNPLRVVIPFIFYHGAKQWEIPTQFLDMFDVDKKLKEYLLDFNYVLFDTNNWSLNHEINIDLKDNIYLFTSMLLMKASFEENPDTIKNIFKFWHEKGFLTKDIEKAMFYFVYISQTKDLDKKQLEAILEGTDIEEKVMKLAERLRMEGYEQGIERGLERGLERGIEKGILSEKRKVLSNLMKLKFGLSEKDKEKINSVIDNDKLEKAIESMLTVSTKKKILEIL